MSLRLFRPTTQRAIAGARFNSSQTTVQDDVKFYPVYVHHLSKVVLEHFQNKHNDWVVNHHLEGGLKLNADGTFVMGFPSASGYREGGRIWTSYDGAKKYHWLSCYKDGLVGRFLIKDASEETNLSDEVINAHVRQSVDHLIQKFEEKIAR